MSRAPNLSPIDAAVEIEAFTFDYGQVLDSGVVISSATVSCAATAGVDPSAPSRLVGSPSIVTSPSSGQPFQAVVHLVGNTVADEVYRLSCLAVTNDGQTLEIWAHLPSVNPN